MEIQTNHTVKLPLPDLRPENLLYKTSQLRPYRKGGVRLDHQLIRDKHVFHNYGHGGAGISLAFGSGYISAKSVGVYVGPSKIKTVECAVLGCGVMGLFTAIELSKRGYPVRIYTDAMPKFNAQENLSTSQMAAGKWQPGGYDLQADYLKHQTLSKLSFEYYQECIVNRRYRSIRPVKVYDAYSTEEQLRRTNTSFLIESYNPVQVDFGNGKRAKYLEFDSIVLIPDLLLHQLLTEAKLRGVEVIEKRFNDLEEVLSLKEPIIMNCTGLGSQKLFGDKNMRGKKGNLLVYKNVNNVNYMLAARHEGYHVTIYGVGEKLMVGATYLDEPLDPKLDEKHYQRILENAREYFSGDSKLHPSAKL